MPHEFAERFKALAGDLTPRAREGLALDEYKLGQLTLGNAPP